MVPAGLDVRGELDPPVPVLLPGCRGRRRRWSLQNGFRLGRLGLGR